MTGSLIALRVDANGAPRQSRGASSSTVFLRAEDWWGCSRTGPAHAIRLRPAVGIFMFRAY